jgi:hypothetical protein
MRRRTVVLCDCHNPCIPHRSVTKLLAVATKLITMRHHSRQGAGNWSEAERVLEEAMRRNAQPLRDVINAKNQLLKHRHDVKPATTPAAPPEAPTREPSPKAAAPAATAATTATAAAPMASSVAVLAPMRASRRWECLGRSMRSWLRVHVPVTCHSLTPSSPPPRGSSCVRYHDSGSASDRISVP